MLRVSTRGEYGVRLLMDLARHYGEQPRSLTEISQSEGLELKVQYLEQLVRCLRESNLVESTRGAHGGYRLSRAPEQIRMGEVVRALEGPISPMICATEGEMEVICDRLDQCSTRYLWAHVRDAVTSALDAITLAGLLAESEAVHANVASVRHAAPVASGTQGAQFVALSPRVARAGSPSAGAAQGG